MARIVVRGQGLWGGVDAEIMRPVVLQKERAVLTHHVQNLFAAPGVPLRSGGICIAWLGIEHPCPGLPEGAGQLVQIGRASCRERVEVAVVAAVAERERTVADSGT